jgi:hypothetical protein
MSELGIWIAAFLTLAYFSSFWKGNPVFNFAEHLYVGLAAGQAVVAGWGNVKAMALSPLAAGKIIAVVPLVLGFLLYSRFLTGPARWLNRIPTAFIVGVGSGLAFTRFAQSDLIGQVTGTVLDLTNLNSLIIVIAALCTISYFIFTVEPKGPLKQVSQIGRYAMMVAFGSAFSNTVMGRLSLLIGRLQFLLEDWLHIM